MKIRLLLLVLFIAGCHYKCARAADPAPDLRTPGTEYLFDAALGADMLQTLNIHQHPELFSNSIILSRHPNEGQIVGYFVTLGVLHWAVTRALIMRHVDPSVISAWENGTIGLEMAYVKHNASVGIHFYFP